MSSSGTHTTLDREAVARVDASDLVTDILALPEHLRDALWKLESAGLTQWDSPGGLVVAGMGGSAIGGALARAILSDHASRPLLASQRLRAAAVDHARHDGPVRELLGQHRGDAGLLRGRRRHRRAPRRRDRRRASWPSRPAPTASRSSRSPAACSRAPRSAT